jgi:spermidine/putrescine transport system substrate-binding protein
MTDFTTDEAMMRALKARLGRRTVLRGTGALGLGVFGASLLAACGTEGATKTESEQAATEDLSDKEKVINFSNWPFYIDVDEKDESKHPSLDQFAQLSGGTKVNYTEDINDNDQFFGKIRADLSAGNDIKRDIIVLTDWMATRLIRLKWVQKIDHANVPNLRNLAPALQNVDFDKQRDYTIPWQSGVTGIAYNAKVTKKPVTTIEQLFTDPALKGKVTALTEMRDTIGLILLQQGKNTVRFTDDDFDAAIAMLDSAVKSGQIRKFTGNDYASDLAAGNVAACVAWSGDVVQLQADNPDIKFVVPESGAMLWSDNAMIPNKAAHKKNAEQLLNFYYDPANAAKLAIAVNYVCPVAGAQEEVAKLDPELAKNELIFPTEDTMKRLNVFKGLNESQERAYNDKFQKVTGA